MYSSSDSEEEQSRREKTPIPEVEASDDRLGSPILSPEEPKDTLLDRIYSDSEEEREYQVRLKKGQKQSRRVTTPSKAEDSDDRLRSRKELPKDLDRIYSDSEEERQYRVRHRISQEQNRKKTSKAEAPDDHLGSRIPAATNHKLERIYSDSEEERDYRVKRRISQEQSQRKRTTTPKVEAAKIRFGSSVLSPAKPSNTLLDRIYSDSEEEREYQVRFNIGQVVTISNITVNFFHMRVNTINDLVSVKMSKSLFFLCHSYQLV